MPSSHRLSFQALSQLPEEYGQKCQTLAGMYSLQTKTSRVQYFEAITKMSSSSDLIHGVRVYSSTERQLNYFRKSLSIRE